MPDDVAAPKRLTPEQRERAERIATQFPVGMLASIFAELRVVEAQLAEARRGLEDRSAMVQHLAVVGRPDECPRGDACTYCPDIRTYMDSIIAATKRQRDAALAKLDADRSG